MLPVIWTGKMKPEACKPTASGAKVDLKHVKIT